MTINSEILERRVAAGGPSFSLSNRLRRLAWSVAYHLLYRPSPRTFHRWRVGLLRAFGGNVDWTCFVYPDVEVWAPWNLSMEACATLGPGVRCYNIAHVLIGQRAVVSQGTYLCTASHDYQSERFQLFARPIRVHRDAWVAAEAFVGPGVTINEGAVIGARGVTFKDVPEWTVWIGNPAVMVKTRRRYKKV